jgi:hypothetical protein
LKSDGILPWPGNPYQKKIDKVRFFAEENILVTEHLPLE